MLLVVHSMRGSKQCVPGIWKRKYVPVSAAIDVGVRYQLLSGIGRGMVFTLHGKSGTPFQFRPTTVPNKTRGNEMKLHIRKMTTIVPKGTAAKEWYEIATAVGKEKGKKRVSCELGVS